MGSSGPIICSLQRQLNLNLPDLYQCHLYNAQLRQKRNEMKCAPFPAAFFSFFSSSRLMNRCTTLSSPSYCLLALLFLFFSLQFCFIFYFCFRFLLLSIGPISSLSEPYDPIFRHHLKISFLRPSNRARPPCLLFQLSLSLFVKFPNHWDLQRESVCTMTFSLLLILCLCSSLSHKCLSQTRQPCHSLSQLGLSSVPLIALVFLLQWIAHQLAAAPKSSLWKWLNGRWWAIRLNCQYFTARLKAHLSHHHRIYFLFFIFFVIFPLLSEEFLDPVR